MRARGGGRGIFCVSESGGAQIDRVDIADTGSNAILVENFTATNTSLRWSPCSGQGNVVRDVTRVNAPLYWC